MTTYGYMRVSTDDQMHDLQKNALIASGIPSDNIFADTISGKTLHRPELSRLQEQLESGDTLVVWKLDRLGRSLGNLILMIDEFNQQGVHFRSLTEQLDTTTPAGKCMFHVVGAFAQMEREVISQRTKEGLAATAARGTRLGRPPIHKLKREKIIRLSQEPGMSLRKIAKKTQVAHAVVQRILRQLKDNPPDASAGNEFI